MRGWGRAMKAHLQSSGKSTVLVVSVQSRCHHQGSQLFATEDLWTLRWVSQEPCTSDSLSTCRRRCPSLDLPPAVAIDFWCVQLPLIVDRNRFESAIFQSWVPNWSGYLLSVFCQSNPNRHRFGLERTCHPSRSSLPLTLASSLITLRSQCLWSDWKSSWILRLSLLFSSREFALSFPCGDLWRISLSWEDCPRSDLHESWDSWISVHLSVYSLSLPVHIGQSKLLELSVANSFLWLYRRYFKFVMFISNKIPQ